MVEVPQYWVKKMNIENPHPNPIVLGNLERRAPIDHDYLVD